MSNFELKLKIYIFFMMSEQMSRFHILILEMLLKVFNHVLMIYSADFFGT